MFNLTDIDESKPFLLELYRHDEQDSRYLVAALFFRGPRIDIIRLADYLGRWEELLRRLERAQTPEIVECALDVMFLSTINPNAYQEELSIFATDELTRVFEVIEIGP